MGIHLPALRSIEICLAFGGTLLVPSIGVGSGKSLLQLSMLIAMSAATCSAGAQTAVSVATSNEADTDAVNVGDTTDALPGVHRIGVSGSKGPRASTSLNFLYGFTEAQNESSDSHQRLGASWAIAIAPWSFAALGLRTDSRHDIHGSDDDGSDSGSVLDLTPHLRLGTVVGPGVHLGVEGRAKLAGATVGESGGPDPEIDARALLAYSGAQSWVFAAHGGYKVGHGGSIVEESANMRDGDRVALGISEFDAILMGLGVIKTIKQTELLGEVTSEMLLGSGAPGFVESPLRAALGVRHPLAHHLWLNGTLEGSIGGRPPSLPGDPLAPIEPRIQAVAGVTWRFLAPKERTPAQIVVAPARDKADQPEEKKDAPVEVGPPPVLTTSVQVTVVDEKDHPISDASVMIEIPASDGIEARTESIPLDDRNVYVISDVPLGEVEITVKADLLKTQTQTIELGEGETTEVEFKLEKADNVGSQLRGLVRSYSGEGIAASVRVEPGDKSTMCDDSGSFELDLPPGVYKVIIEAEGYRSQRRTLRVRQEGVTVLNADLQQATD